MRFFPVFLDLDDAPVLLVGGGEAAENKLRLLRAAGARVRWHVDDAATVDRAEADERVEVVRGAASPDLGDVVAVVVASGRDADMHIAARARSLRIPVNVVDRPDLSSFIVPAIVDRGDVVVAIGTGGAAPVLARRLRERIEAVLPARIGGLAALMGRYRERLAAALSRGLSRRRFWEKVVDGPIAAALLAGRPLEAEAALVRAIEAARREPETASHAVGTVFLVGAGPGDPDLLTLRASQVLQGADILFYDELVTPEVLDRARRDAVRVFVGKRRGAPGVGQGEINDRLVQAARSGQQVVRLKGGDPLVFGRGGEELAHLRDAGIPVIVVAGITAALGCAAEAGLPLTFRREASRLTFVTARHADDAATTDWSDLAAADTTLAVYMGLAAATAVRDGLVAAGRGTATPVAVLARGSRPDSRFMVGRLDDLPSLAAAAGEGPALLVIGETVRRSALWDDAAQTAAQEAA